MLTKFIQTQKEKKKKKKRTEDSCHLSLDED